MLRRTMPLLLLLGAVLAPGAAAQHIKAKYDAFTDRTTATDYFLFDSPMLGAEKRLILLWTFAGQSQAAPADSMLLVVQLIFTHSPGAISDGDAPNRPTLYFLADDSIRMSFEPTADESHFRDLGTTAFQQVASFGYALSMANVRRLLGATTVAFKVGPWQRNLKDKELNEWRTVAEIASDTAARR